jgi:imidazole glycerol-phosphate synthase subunit HisH
MFDSGAGNLHSLGKALALAGADVRAETNPLRAIDTDVLVLPGVGAFSHAAEQLAAGRDVMRSAIRDGLPTLGICLGMQLLFAESDEGPGLGLDIIAGRVERISARRVPHIGWNRVHDQRDPLFVRAPLEYAYYANSFVARPAEPCVTAWTTHEADRFPAVVRAKNAIGVQFHPEKSSAPGIAFLAAALEGLDQ